MKKFFVFFFLGVAGITGAFFAEHFLIMNYGINMHEWFYPSYYSGNFPETAFPCKKGLESHYKETVERGYQRMKQSKMVICGLARNTAQSLSLIKNRLEQTGKLFKNYRIVIFENDSADATRDILKQWESDNSHIHLIKCSQPDCKFGDRPLYEYGITGRDRITKMAQFRNIYLDYVKKIYADYDYVIVVDMDLKGPWSLDGLAHSVGSDNWDVIAAYGLHSLIGTLGNLLVMYDGLAYVAGNGSYEDPKRFIQNYFRMNFLNGVGAKKGDPLIPVKSAFSGLAIYTIKSIVDSHYKPGICEHVGFHQSMAENGYDRIFINPSMILLSGHQGPLNTIKILTSYYK